MKTEFQLDFHNAECIGAKINIVGKRPDNKPYVSIQTPKYSLFIYDEDLERFAVNILKALKSKKLKQQ